MEITHNEKLVCTGLHSRVVFKHFTSKFKVILGFIFDFNLRMPKKLYYRYLRTHSVVIYVTALLEYT